MHICGSVLHIDRASDAAAAAPLAALALLFYRTTQYVYNRPYSMEDEGLLKGCNGC